MIESALHAFSVFAGACLVLSVAGVIGLWVVCWGIEIWRELVGN